MYYYFYNATKISIALFRSPAKSDSSVKKNTAKEKEKEEENGEDEFWEEEATTPYFQLPFKRLV